MEVTDNLVTGALSRAARSGEEMEARNPELSLEKFCQKVWQGNGSLKGTLDRGVFFFLKEEIL